MLYSLSYDDRGVTQRMMFYADSEEEAQESLELFARNKEMPVESIRLTAHPNGFRIRGRFYSGKERGKDVRSKNHR